MNFQHLLTLRYDPDVKSTIPVMTSKDVTSFADNIVENTESIIKQKLMNFIDKANPKRISITMSSGVDSTLVLVLLRELYPDIKITGICYGFTGNNVEAEETEKLASKYDVDFVNPIIDNIFENLPKQMLIVQEPKTNLYWYDVVEKAKQYSDILLTGDGADELFGGYIFRYSKLHNLKYTTSHHRIWSYLGCHNRDWVDDQNKIFGNKISFSWDNIFKTLQPHFDNSLNYLDQVFLADYNGKLMHDWIPTYDKIYSHLNMRSFSPFLNTDLIKFSFTIPHDKKYDKTNNVGKIILRNILNKRKIQVSTKKLGFSPNLLCFWDDYGKEIAKYYLSSSKLIKDDWINAAWMESALVKACNKDIRYINKILQMIAFEIWYRIFITKEMTGKEKL